MRVKLTKKFAEVLNGVDLSRARAGDMLDMSPGDACLLLASEWALPAEKEESHDGGNVLQMPTLQNRAEAADCPRGTRARTA